MPTLAPRSTEEIESTLAQAAASARERLRRKKARQTKIIALAIIGSLLLHALFVPLFSWMVAHWPRKPLPPGNAPFHLSLTRSDDEGPKADASPQQSAPYMRTTSSQETDEQIDRPDFISDKNTKAASEQPADANKPPLPSQEGRDRPTYDFDTTPYRPGKEASDAASAAQTAQQATTAAPNETPQPNRKTTAVASQSKTSPKAAATPKPTPVPDGELATMAAQPTPVDEPPHPDETPSDTPPPPMARASTQQPSRTGAASAVTSTGAPRLPGYQPQTIQSRMRGSINSRGRAAVMAQSTPLGRYEKAVEDAIGSMWYIDVNQQMSYLLSSAEVKLHFYVTRSGRVRSVRVSGGDPNNTLASLSIGAVSEAEIAPIPPEVSAMLPGGELEVDMGFQFEIH